MKRNLARLTSNSFDLLVVGGGIYGACLAWDASLRGLSVALVEQADFASATSANSLKTIHGGLRYLQHADFSRMRESIRERSTLMRIAPHLVHPLPVVVPTYGHGLKGSEVMRVALSINDWVSLDRNWHIPDPQKHIPNGRVISAVECLQRLPGISTAGLTGGAIFYDAQVYNSERLIMSMLHSAVQAGAEVANQVEVSGFLQSGDRVTGVRAIDRQTGEPLEIQANFVVNTVGPWSKGLMQHLPQPPYVHGLAKAMNFVTRPLFKDYAVGISSAVAYEDKDAVLKKGSRFLFIAPWRDRSLVGTWYAPFDGHPSEFAITEADIQTFLSEVNHAYPAANLKREEIEFVHGGLLPSTGVSPKSGDVQLAKHYTLYDHRQDGIAGMLSVIGVKYTTARDVAEKTLDWIGRTTGKKLPRSTASATPVWGGEIQNFAEFLQDAIRQHPHLPEATVRRLVYSYGSAYQQVLSSQIHPAKADLKADLSDLAVLQAEVLHSIREEMAQHLADVVFRRTEIGSAGLPCPDRLRHCAEVMAAELGWSPDILNQELATVERTFTWMQPANQHATETTLVDLIPSSRT
ncbi:MAG: glycerol-3-phosphate dehydrogenase/oxidase [Cyanobacteria bacterium RM1_2_2]|nr:glycerol-3-phosphate dehydrogenase/oxidase [Cyanobacteria bacterium RM1_2_2]